MLPSDSGGVRLSFCFLRTPDTSRVQTEASEHEARDRNYFAPRLWLKCWVLLPKAARGGGDAPHPRRPGKAAPSATPRPRPSYNTREATTASRKRTDGPARTQRALGTSSARARDAQTTRLARTTGAFPGAQTARLRGVRSVCFLNLSVWTLVWLLCDLSGWAPFALNHRLSAVDRES